MAMIFLVVAAAFFFLAAVGSTLLPSATAWGLVALAIGLACNASYPSFIVRQKR